MSDLPPHRASVLLVEPDPADLRALQAMLAGLDVDLVAARSADDALEHAAARPFAAVLIDVDLPGLDGFETARRIRAEARSRATPVLFLAARELARETIERGYELGAVDFLEKPPMPAALRAKVRGFAALFADAQRAEREAEQLRLIVHGTTDYAIFMLDPGGRVVTWNTGAERLKGYAAEEIVGRHFSTFYPREVVDRGWPDHELRVAAAEGRFEDEGWRLRKDGSRFWADVVITALRDEAGVLRGFSKVTRDLTERRQAEEAARRLAEEAAARRAAERNAELVAGERERLRVTLASIGDAVITTDREGRVEFLNPIAQALVGWSAEEAAGRPLEEVFRIVNEQTRQPVENPALRALAEGTVVGLANHTLLIARDGTERPIDDSASPIRHSTGEVAGAVLVFRDISARRRAEEELREQTLNSEVLARVGKLLAQEVELQGLVQVVTDEATALCGAQFGAFFYNVVGDSGEAYTLYTISGVPREAFAGFPMPRNTGVFGPTFRGEGVVRSADVTQDPRYGNNAPYHGMPEGHLPVRSYLAVPVVSRSGEVLGGLFFGHAQAGVFTARHERLLTAVAGQAAIAIDNTRLFERAQASAARLQLALTAADLGDWSWDAASDVVTLSPRAAEIFGIPPGPRTTWTAMQELLHVDDREHARREVERAVAERVPYDVEYRVGRADGTVAWVGALGSAVADDSGRVTGMYGVVQDVTERKRLEESLRESEERLRLALDAGRMGVWDWDVRTGALRWSESLEPLHGIPPGTFGGTFEHFLELVHPLDRAALEAAIQRALAERGEFYVEFRNAGHDGRVRWIAGSGKVFAGADGAPQRMIGIGLDVTERRRSEQTARFLAEASAALAGLVDFDSTLQKVASLAVPRFADWMTVDVLEGGALRRVAVAHVDPTKVELAHELRKRIPGDPEAPNGAWHILRSGSPELVPEIGEEMLARTIPDEETLALVRELGLRSYIGVPLTLRGRPRGVLTFIAAESGHTYDSRDLEVAQDLAHRASIAVENAELYEELRQADRRKDEFLATLAHELRNPLAPIRNGLQVFRLAGPETPLIARTGAMMERQVEHLVRLVDDLLDVSRITRNRLELRKERVALADVVHNAIEASRPLIEQSRHTFSVTLPGSPVFLDADPVRLAQVLSNLLNNAARYTPPGGRIELAAEVAGAEAVVRVRDTGLGIPAEALSQIFEMFTQVARDAPQAQGGLGIGLTLVRRLVEMHGGTVEAFSEGRGRGSELVVRLPLPAPDQRRPPELAATAPPPGGTTRRILVVDDNRDAAETLGLMLSLMGNEVRTVFDGPAALATAEEFRPEVILLDIGLPTLDGYEVCRRMRGRPWSAGTLIVALTGWGQEEDRRRSQEAGFDHHLVKPVELGQLGPLLANGKA